MTENQYKAILFDLDGTLLNTLEDICDSMNYVLKKRGFPAYNLDAYRYFVGEGAAMLVAKTLPEDERNDETIHECHEAFKEHYAHNWNVKTKPYNGVPEMLDAITKRDHKLAILSNKPHDFTKQCVANLLPQWDFDVIFGLRDSIPRKPDPAGALLIAERLNVTPSRFLYAGDTLIDMKTAVAAGMFPVGVRWGFRPVEELLENGARAILNHPLEILDILG